MGGLPVQTPAHAALRAPMPKLSLPEYHARMSALADACSPVYFQYCPGFRTRGDVRPESA
jgi:hypothetical protein